MKKRIFVQAITCVILSMFIVGCNYDIIIPEDNYDPSVTYSFSEDVQPIFDQSCSTVGCHNQGGIAPVLEVGKAYDALFLGDYINTDQPESSELYQWMLGNRSLSMPLSGPDAEYNATILGWIKQGALNN